MTGWRAAGTLSMCVALCIGVGASASFVTAQSVKTWYPTLSKPSWTPPDWLFGPVWTLLYIAMGVAVWLVWRASKHRAVGGTIAIFALQLALNAAWSFIFFGAQAVGWALAEIVVLWLAIVVTVFAFSRIDSRAAVLLVPYLAWVSFATALNFAIWRLNP